MSIENENLIFLLKKKDKEEIIYKYEVELAEFQKKTISNENISFFYTFKDASLELEEELCSKKIVSTTANKSDEIDFVIKLSDENLYETSLDAPAISKEDVEKNEMQLYFAFEKISKGIIGKILEEHKKIVLSEKQKD